MSPKPTKQRVSDPLAKGSLRKSFSDQLEELGLRENEKYAKLRSWNASQTENTPSLALNLSSGRLRRHSGNKDRHRDGIFVNLGSKIGIGTEISSILERGSSSERKFRQSWRAGRRRNGIFADLGERIGIGTVFSSILENGSASERYFRRSWRKDWPRNGFDADPRSKIGSHTDRFAFREAKTLGK